MSHAQAKPAPLPEISTSKWWPWLGISGLLLISVLVYLPSLQGSFLWDDNAHVTRPELRSAFGLARIWFELGATQQYYPVLHSAFWIEHRLWGDSVLGYHLLNVVLHTLAAGLIITIMRQLAIRGAWLAGFVFALHPVCVESVAWISEQKNTLSTVFYLAALWAYLRFDQHRANASPAVSHRFYALASVCFLLAALTKTVTVTLPAALLVIFWWQRGRLTRRDFLPLLPWFIFGIAAGLMTAWVERTYIGASGEAFDLNLWQRTLLAGQIICFYFSKLIWPTDLMFIYPRWDMTVTTLGHYLGLAAALAVLITLWRLRHRSRAPLATALLFGGTLFPALGFFNVFPFQFSYVADHFQYLAGIYVIVALCALITRWTQPLGWIRSTAAGILLATLATLSWQQAHHYRDNITLYRTTLDQNPACWLASYNLGLELADLGQTSEAIKLYRQTLRLKPDYAEVHANLGLALSRTPGGLSDGIAELEKAVRLKPTLYPAQINLANLLTADPIRRREAIPIYRDLLRHDPTHVGVRFNLGLALLYFPHRQTEALHQFMLAAKLDPDYWQAHYQVGVILMNQRRDLDRAIDAFETVLQLKPDENGARFRLAQMFSVTPGHRQDALDQLHAILRRDPHNRNATQLLQQLSY